MQPGVTVVLATAWLAVYVLGTPIIRLSRPAYDQYSPLAPQRHKVYGGVEGQLDEKDQNPAENQPFHFSIGSRRSISTSTEHPAQSSEARYFQKDFYNSRAGNSGYFPSPVDDKSHNIVGPKFTNEKVDNRSTKELSPREPPPSELEDSFVADDTFQDQGPGSVEIYKLDLQMGLLAKSKSKTPKKTSHADWKPKMVDYKATSPKVLYKQSNFFDDTRTEIPLNIYPFGVGGVPELQVGCEGLETSNSKFKRSIDSSRKDKSVKEPWLNVTPVSLDLDYDFSSEEDYEEMDELVRLKKLETVTENGKHNRGDIEVSLQPDSYNDKHFEKLPNRGDLGNATVNHEVSTSPHDYQKEKRLHKQKRNAQEAELTSSDGEITKHGRKILWVDTSEDKSRSKRAPWGFDEDEGVLSSDELQTETQRRRQDYERRRQEAMKRRQEYSDGLNDSEVKKIRDDYEMLLKQKHREEEERQRRLQEEQNVAANRQRSQEERRIEELRRQELEATRRRHEFSESLPEEEERGRQRMLEEQRRREEVYLRKEDMRRKQLELDRRNLEERRREWMLKRREEEEKERKRQERNRIETPANLQYPERGLQNVSRPYETETDRRTTEEQEREREMKLREYTQRNRPIKVNSSVDQQREEANRRRVEDQREKRLEEERKLQEYIRRNQPVHLPKANVSHNRNWMAYWKPINEVNRNNNLEYQRPESQRRNHGPSPPSNVDPWSHINEARRREASRRIEEERVREIQRQEQEQRRREALRREEEFRRMQSRRYEEERKRLEAARLEADRRTKELLLEEARRSQTERSRPSESTGRRYENRQRFEGNRRRQDTSLIPANLLLNDSRKAIELERQRQEHERRRIETERRRQEESRAKETRDNDERVRAMREQWMQQEKARLNALPVSARIIIRPGTPSQKPTLTSRGAFDNGIEHMGLNPYGKGIRVPNFPAPPTRRPPVKSPSACTWAVVQCCSSNVNRIVRCFESLGCPGVNWDPNPCRDSIKRAARNHAMRYYEEEGETN